jgi:hypothetical protein
VDLGTIQLAGGDTTRTSDDLIITGTGAAVPLPPGAPCTLPPDALELSDDGVRLLVRLDGGVGTVFVDGAVKIGAPTTEPLFEVTGFLSTNGTGELTAALDTAALGLPINVDAEATLRLDGPDGFELTVQGRIVVFDHELVSARLRIGFADGVFTVAVPEPGIVIDLGFAALGVHGFVDSTGAFSLTGSFSTDGAVPNPFGGDIVSWNGSIEVTISSGGGISGAFEGRVTIFAFTAEASASMSSDGEVKGAARADLNGDGSFAGFTACLLVCVDIVESAEFQFDIGAGDALDTQAPTMTQPRDVRVQTSETSKSIPVDFIPPVAQDDLSGEIRAVCNRAPGSEFAVNATTKVTCTATDAAGNTATRSFDVIVERFEIPEVTAFKLAQETEIEQDGLDDGTISKLILRSTPRELSEVVVAADGVAAHSFEIPADIEPGDHHLEVHGLADGDPVVTIIPIVIDTSGEITFVEGVVANEVFVSLDPERFANSKNTLTFDGLFAGIGPVAGGTFWKIKIADRGGVPDTAIAAIVNVTATGATSDGNLRVYPCTTDVPTVSSINFSRDTTEPNEVIAKLSNTGHICVYASATVHVLVDVVGYVDNGSPYTPIDPARYANSRNTKTFDGDHANTGPIAGGTFWKIKIADRGAIPASATTVVANVTVTGPQGNGNLRVYPCTDDVPGASSLNYTAGLTRPNEVVAKLSDSGHLCIWTKATAHIIVDAVGYIDDTPGYTPIDPTRYAHSAKTTTFDGNFAATGPVTGGTFWKIQIADRGVIPADTTTVVANVTVTNPAANGNLRVYPCTPDIPGASSLNYTPGMTRPNELVAKLSDTGHLCIWTKATTAVIVDIVGHNGTTP